MATKEEIQKFIEAKRPTPEYKAKQEAIKKEREKYELLKAAKIYGKKPW